MIRRSLGALLGALMDAPAWHASGCGMNLRYMAAGGLVGAALAAFQLHRPGLAVLALILCGLTLAAKGAGMAHGETNYRVTYTVWRQRSGEIREVATDDR